MAQLKFATDILRRLGEELNPSLDQGILELVKNAYDADAGNCTIELIDTDRVGGTIRIEDDGVGMDSDAIQNGWLVLGSSNKSPTQRSRLGRIPAGNKGLGRLAALRMGTLAELVSSPSSDPENRFRLVIDWRAYEQADYINEVVLDVETLTRDSVSSGSTITIRELHHSLTRADIRRLARGLLLLADPFEDDSQAFRPKLIAPEFADLEQLVQRRYFHEADFHLIAEVDEAGYARASVVDWRGEALFVGSHQEIMPHKANMPYRCPPLRFDLWHFVLNKEMFSARSVTIGEVKEWLQEFGGVFLYDNGLRVHPYGNPGNDWLDLNLSRNRDPDLRPSTNNSIGKISIRNANGTLLQKTDRSGFVETEAFLELKMFAQNALNWMARRRKEQAEVRRRAERASTTTQSDKARNLVETAIQSVPPAVQDDVRRAFDTYAAAREQEVKVLRKEVQLYRTLSTAGITAATFAHESTGNPIKVIQMAIRAIERRGRELNLFFTGLDGPVKEIHKAVGVLAVLGKATLRLLDSEKRRPGHVDIHRVICETLNTFAPFITGRDAAVETEFAVGSPFLQGSAAALESIVTNLLNNSLTALEHGPHNERKIRISTTVIGDEVQIEVADNGPGIQDVDLTDIWLPGETTRPGGTGLGLTIVRDTVADLGGRTDALAHGTLGGATIRIVLPILGV
jgi:signal transduction histidine kinase